VVLAGNWDSTLLKQVVSMVLFWCVVLAGNWDSTLLKQVVSARKAT